MLEQPPRESCVGRTEDRVLKLYARESEVMTGST